MTTIGNTQTRCELAIGISMLLISRWGEAETIDPHKIMHPASPRRDRRKTQAGETISGLVSQVAA